MFRFLCVFLMSALCASQAMAQRSIDPMEPRLDVGLVVDGAPPRSQIAPWDSTALDSWLELIRAGLVSKITDPNVLAKAADFTPYPFGDQTTHSYTATDWATEIINVTQSRKDANDALYVLFAMAEAGDPFAYIGIEQYFRYGWGELPDGVRSHDFFRKAADLDHLSSIVTVVEEWMYGIAETDPGTIEAYLRYGMDIAPRKGAQDLASAVLDFYVHDHKGARPADGYALRALHVYRSVDQGAWTNDYLSFMHRYGVDVARDDALELNAAIRAVIDGNTRMRLTVGFMVMQGLGTPYDVDVARDVLVDCYEEDGDAFCLDNLAILYDRENEPQDNPVLAYALYRYASSLSQEVAMDQADHVGALANYLSSSQIALSDFYLEKIERGDFAGIPHLEDVRPVNYSAWINDRER